MLIDTFANRLQRAMNINNMKPVDLVRKTKLDKSLISNYLSGKYKAKQDNLTILSYALNTTETWLMGYDVPMTRTTMPAEIIEVIKVPILGKISAGTPILAEESFEGYAFAPSTQIKSEKEYFYLRVKGDSMNLKFIEGSIVLIEKTNTLENGDIGVIAINGYEATIKKYRYENNLVILEPMSTNPNHTISIFNTKDIEIHILGKAISFQGNL